MGDPKDISTEESNLNEILNTYPKVQILIEGDWYTVTEDEPGSPANERFNIDMGIGYNEKTNRLNPVIAHSLPGLSIYIDFTPDGIVYSIPEVEKIHYERMLKLAKKGLEILSAYQNIPLDVMQDVDVEYWSRVSNHNEYEDQYPMSIKTISKVLRLINQELGE